MAKIIHPPSTCHPDRPQHTKNIRVCRQCYQHSWYLSRKHLIIPRQHQDRLENPQKYRGRYREKRKRHPEKYKLWAKKDRLRRYGMSIEDYEAFIKQHKSRCDICDKEDPGRLHIDHDHKTGKVRGLLCRFCNPRLGLLEKGLYEDWMVKAKQYLEMSKTSPEIFTVKKERRKYLYHKNRKRRAQVVYPSTIVV